MRDYGEYFLQDDEPPKRPVKVLPALQDLTPAGIGKIKPPKKPVKLRKPKQSPPQGAVLTLSQRDTRDQYEAILTFLAATGNRGTIYVGIDPGSEGAIGLLYPPKPEITTAVDIPTVRIKLSRKNKKPRKDGTRSYATRNRYNLAEIWRWFGLLLPHRNRIVVCLEELYGQHGDTPLTAFALGVGYGMWPLFLTSHQFALEERNPGVWKKRIGLQGKDKEYSRLMAQKLWPQAPLFNVGHHNRAEALLLAEQVRRERKGK